MKKTILSVACIILMMLGLFLVSCQKQETATKEAPVVEAPAAEAPAESAGSSNDDPFKAP